MQMPRRLFSAAEQMHNQRRLNDRKCEWSTKEHREAPHLPQSLRAEPGFKFQLGISGKCNRGSIFCRFGGLRNMATAGLLGDI